MWICVDFLKQIRKNPQKPVNTGFSRKGKKLKKKLLFAANHGRIN